MRIRSVCIALMILAQWASADVAPPLGGRGSHYVDRSAVILDLSLTGDTVLLACTEQGSAVIVDSALTVSSTVRLVAVSRSRLEGLGGVAGVNCSAIRNLPDSLASSISLWPYRIDDEYSLISETYYYEVEGISNGRVVLRLVKRVLGYDDGGADEVITY